MWESGRKADKQKLWRASGVSKLALRVPALDFVDFGTEHSQLAVVARDKRPSFVQAPVTSSCCEKLNYIRDITFLASSYNPSQI